MALLKSMKQRVRYLKKSFPVLNLTNFRLTQKIVDFVGPMLTDDSTVTLINDYYQEFKTQLITYDEIKDKVKGTPAAFIPTCFGWKIPLINTIY